MINWHQVETVLLDMDGTLLDLHFDNHFWLTVVPQHLSLQQKRPITEIKKQIYQMYQEAEGSLNWYCIHHWQQKLGLDIMLLKQQYKHKINWLQDAKAFLQALKQAGKQRILITNAHPLSLELKQVHTGLDNYLDQIYSTHQFGVAKESPQLWQQLKIKAAYNPKTTLFIDDNESLLLVAKQAGIAFGLGIYQPDSQKRGNEMKTFKTIKSYRALITELKGSTA